MSEVHFYPVNKNKEKTSLEAIIRYKGQRFKFPVGESINPNYWNPDKYRCREVRDYPDGKDINERLDEWDKLLSGIIHDYGIKLIIPSQKYFRNSVEKVLKEREKAAGMDAEDEIYFTDFIKDFADQAQRKPNTIKRYITTLNLLKLYEGKKRLTFNDIDISFYNKLQKWMNDRDYSLNYFGDMIKNIKVFMSEAKERGLHENTGYLSKKFKTADEESDTIYLSVDELIKIHKLVIDEKLIIEKEGTKILNVTGNMERKIRSLNDARDRFLIGSFTALRFGDYGSLDGIKSTDDYVTKRRTQKTGIKVVIPMHWVIKDILLKRDNILPKPVSNQKMNDSLKDLGYLADIKDIVEITITKGGKRVTTNFEKWELITTHTARRSGCTNMYLAGIDMYSIMGFSGHNSVSSFLKYIKVKQEENAIRLKDHAFFQKEPLVSTPLSQQEANQH